MQLFFDWRASAGFFKKNKTAKASESGRIRPVFTNSSG
jgi:hypothetical protein